MGKNSGVDTLIDSTAPAPPAIDWTGADAALATCPWCRAGPDRPTRRLTGRLLCQACGVAATDPWPDDASLEAAYGGAYRPSGGRFTGPGDAILAITRGTLARRLHRIAPPGPMLDVGAGSGGLVAALAGRGRQALGLEREAHGDAIVDATLAEMTGSWAAIVFWHSLEHLPEPRADLDRAIDLLAPGAVMTIAIPNAASLQARLFGDAWLALDLPRHLTHIPAGALVDRLRERGLDVERVSHWRGGQVLFGWLHGLVRLTPGRPSLYDALRRPAARFAAQDDRRRTMTLAAAVPLAPFAALAALLEIGLGRGGTVYVEARRPR
jgi:SAM-dependent methyltransferase